ncbi:MAG: hypothetical protein ABFE01_07495, partial [Phycisphaerales bacterium]
TPAFCALGQQHENDAAHRFGAGNGRLFSSLKVMPLAQGGKCPPARRAAAKRRIPDLSVPSFVPQSRAAGPAAEMAVHSGPDCIGGSDSL